MPPTQQPTLGRVVIYRTREGHDYAAVIAATPSCEQQKPAPAKGRVRLSVFWDGNRADWMPDEGVPGPAKKSGHWRWPERV